MVLKDNLGEASRIITKRLEAEGNSKRVLKPEKDQGYAIVLPAARAKKQPQKPRDTPKKLSKDGLEREEKQLQETS